MTKTDGETRSASNAASGDGQDRESGRLAALRSYDILDTPREAEFDDIVQMVARACDTPLAYINFLDERRQWFKAEIGYDVDELPRDSAICSDTINEADLLYVADLSRHPTYANSIFVTGPRALRFYAGVPLRTADGFAIGTLCVLDRVPRDLTDQQLFILRTLGRTVMAQLEMRKAIAARARTEERLRESEDHLRHTVELNPQVPWTCDPHGNITSYSNRWLELTGQAPGEPLGSGWAKALHPDDLEATVRHFTASLGSGNPVDVDYRILVPSAGDYRWMRARAHPRRNDAGAIIQWYGVVEDIHDRKLAEEGLRESEARYRTLFDSIDVGFCIIEFLDGPHGPMSDYIHVEANAAYTHHAGIPNVVGQKVREMVPDEAGGWVELYRRVLQTGESIRFERELVATRRHLELAAFRIEPASRRQVAVLFQDVTGRRQAERRASDNERELRLIADSLPVLIAFVDANQTYRFANAAYRDWFDMPPEEIVGRDMKDLPSPVSYDNRRYFIEQALGGEDVRYELPWPHRDGRARDAEVRYLPRRGADGRVEGIYVFVQDITARKQAEVRKAALLSFSDRVRDVADPKAIMFAACEVLGVALRASRVSYGIVDAAAEKIVKARAWTSPGIPSLPDDSGFQDHGVAIDDLKRGVTVIVGDTETDPRTRDQPDSWWMTRTRAFVRMPVIERRRFVALLCVDSAEARVWGEAELGILREVADRTRVATERARLDAERREQAAELAALNASLERQVEVRTRERDQIWKETTDLFCVASLDGYFLSLNPAWQRVLGWSDAELKAVPFIDFVHPDDRASTLLSSSALANQEPQTRFENRYRSKDGTYRWLSWNAVPHDDVVYATVRDVTDLKVQEEALQKTQAALRQSQKMEAVGQLTGGIAHDFNNLLTGITGSLEILNTRVAQGRIADVERYTTAAYGAAKRAAALTHRLLAFSRQQTLDPKPTDVNRLVAGMEDLLRRTVGPTIRIEIVAAGGLWPTLIDPPQLESALLNLCINARDAMPDGGAITIETANKWFDRRFAKERELEPGQYISLCVSDTGMGMTPDVIEKAFEPFFTTKPLGQGTGLGLSMIYGFVRQSGGQVRIYSEVSGGTNVCLYLPRHIGQQDVVEPESEFVEVSRARVGETVLVVDDEPTIRMLVTEVLEELGYAAIEAADSASGLRVLQSDVRIDLVVTDVGLPGGMNGRQMVDAARVRRPKLKVLFITGYAENAVVGNGHLAPGMHVMTKPFDMDVLAGRIQELIRGA